VGQLFRLNSCASVGCWSGYDKIISSAFALSDAAADYFKRKKCQVELLPMGAVIRAWNAAEGVVIGLFHVTC